jgi:cytochrome c oxidase assembly protein Cox11
MTVFIDSLDGVSNIMIVLYNGICGKSGLYYLTKRERKPKGQSRMDNQEKQVMFDTRHRTKTSKTKITT